MKMTYLGRTLVIASAALVIAGCNIAGKNTKGTGAQVASGVSGDTGENASATTYGLNGSQAIGEQPGMTTSGAGAQNAQVGSDQRVQNSMNAPENQTYYFAFNSYNVNQQDLPYIASQAHYLVAHPNAKIRLEGNTDDRGSREYNIGLGWKRDQSVQRILEQQGVNANQIAMVSYGKERPAVVGDTEAAWALNRRVNLVFERL